MQIFLTKSKLLANLAMLITVSLWGMSFISIKTAVSEVPPITLALLRFMIASTILLIITRKVEPTSHLQRPDYGKMMIAGVQCRGVDPQYWTFGGHFFNRDIDDVLGQGGFNQ